VANQKGKLIFEFRGLFTELVKLYLRYLRWEFHIVEIPQYQRWTSTPEGEEVSENQGVFNTRR